MTLLRRILYHVGWVLALCLVVVSIPAQAAEDAVEIEGEVVAVSDGRVRVELAPSSVDSVPAPGDSVSFHKTVDGFELEAGSGVVDEVGAGFVWVETSDERVNVGVEARVRATGEPGAPVASTIGMDVALANQSVVGTVEQIADGRATVSSRPGRVGIAPGQLVRFQSRIPGVDEVVESASGYILSSKRERIRVAITQGETAIGDEAVLLPEHRDGRISTDQDEWYRMEYEDIWKAARLKPPNLGALCALARHYRDGGHVKKNPKDARALYRHASGFGPPALCAYEYGTLLYDGDLDNPSAMRRNPQEGEKWIRYSAEHGSYDGMCSYAGILELRGEYAKAIRWLKKARAIEPEVLKNLGSVSTDIERIRRKQRRH